MTPLTREDAAMMARNLTAAGLAQALSNASGKTGTWPDAVRAEQAKREAAAREWDAGT